MTSFSRTIVASVVIGVLQSIVNFNYIDKPGLMLIAPDTSPRGLDLPGIRESWDFGEAAGGGLVLGDDGGGIGAEGGGAAIEREARHRLQRRIQVRGVLQLGRIDRGQSRQPSSTPMVRPGVPGGTTAD